MSAVEGTDLGRTVEVTAPAKINPFLRVVGRRPDGYHEVETLILPVSLADRLSIHAGADPSAHRVALDLEVRGVPAAMAGVPADRSNLVLRAAAALAEAAGVRGFAHVVLDKRIPAAAGLGGGSADAAATLRALNYLWRCGLSAGELGEVAASVGSDVPALLSGHPAVARGRGERVQPVPVPRLRWCLVALPFGVRTQDAYQWSDEDEVRAGPDPAPVLEAMARGDPRMAGPLLFNDLEPPVLRRHPEVLEAKRRLLDGGAVGAVMCGSGPTVVGLLGPDATVLPGAVEVWSAP